MGRALAAEQAIDPISQFQIKPIVPIHLGSLDLSFTNSSLFMVVVLGLSAALMLLGTGGHALVPGKVQSAAEMSYEFTANMIKQTAGRDGMRFFPFVFAIFLFVMFSNVLGLFPYSFAVTSQIVVTAALALLVNGLVVVYGLLKHGPSWLRLFVPHGVNPFLLPFISLIEVISFISRPISLSVRLFANMLAGHITLKVFGAFVASLLGAGAFAVLAPLPFVMTIILSAFELLVALLQAYVFTILTCVYLSDAIHPGH
jgi:F-type H+-transporting ATPase subunit a